jgi:hypothetical protein
MKSWIAAVLIGLLITLTGYLYADQEKDIEKKADKEVVTEILKRMEVQQNTNQRDLKEQRIEQQKVNQDIYRVIQMMLLKEDK